MGDDAPFDGENPSDKLRDLMLLSAVEESPAIRPFEGFRERIQEEKSKDFIENDPSAIIAKKSVSGQSQNDPNVFADEERLGAHFRKHKLKPLPNTAEYVTGNRINSPLDEEVRENAWKNYKLSFEEKNFPFEYENPDLPESRVYMGEDGTQEFTGDAGSGENVYPFQQKGKTHIAPNPILVS